MILCNFVATLITKNVINMRIKTFLLMVLFAIIPSLGFASLNDNEEIMIEPIGGENIRLRQVGRMEHGTNIMVMGLLMP